MSGTAFIKMHGLGNECVVLDARAHAVSLGESRIRAVADRHTGVGCDPLIAIELAAAPVATAFTRELAE